MGTITVKSMKDKEERVFERTDDKEIAVIKEKIVILTERVVKMEQHSHHNN